MHIFGPNGGYYSFNYHALQNMLSVHAIFGGVFIPILFYFSTVYIFEHF